MLALRLFSEFLLLVAIAPVVQNATDGRIRVGCDFHQVQPALLSDSQGTANVHHSDLLPVLVDNAHLFGADPIVDS